jgi:hypothetical protein
MFGLFGKNKIKSQDFIRLFYDFAHQVAFECVERSPEVYEHYFPGIDKEIVEAERFYFIVWAMDLKLSRLKSSKREDVIIGLLISYLKKIGKLDSAPWQSETAVLVKNKFAEYYALLGSSGSTIERKFIQNIFGDKEPPVNDRRELAMAENLGEILDVIERDFVGKYQIL